MYDQFQSKEESVKVKFETESTPLRHLAIQCPYCKNWFQGDDITSERIHYVEHLPYSDCYCPICQESFSIDPYSTLEESDEFPKFYEQCMHKKTTWE